VSLLEVPGQPGTYESDKGKKSSFFLLFILLLPAACDYSMTASQYQQLHYKT
jgi:hypothetical protein